MTKRALVLGAGGHAGFYSTENADLALGYEHVLVIALRAGNPPLALVSLATAVQELERGGAVVEIVQPDDEAQAILSAANNVLDPAVRVPMLHAARSQGRRLARKRLAFAHDAG